MEKFERKFVVDPTGQAAEQSLTDAERENLREQAERTSRPKKVLRLKEEERKFVVDPEGKVEEKEK